MNKKATKILFAAIMMLTAFSLQSCLDSDKEDYNQFYSRDYAKNIMNGMWGTYDGYAVYQNQETKRPDSLIASMNLMPGDTLMQYTIPSKILARFVDESKYPTIKSAITDEEFTTLNVRAYLSYFLKGSASSLYAFYTSPDDIVLHSVDYNGTVQDLNIKFYSFMQYPFYFSKSSDSKRKLYGLMFIAGIYDSKNNQIIKGIDTNNLDSEASLNSTFRLDVINSTGK